MQIIAKI